eukprot:353690-Chlamydomonas_euryale.AAC.2
MASAKGNTKPNTGPWRCPRCAGTPLPPSPAGAGACNSCGPCMLGQEAVFHTCASTAFQPGSWIAGRPVRVVWMRRGAWQRGEASWAAARP